MKDVKMIKFCTLGLSLLAASVVMGAPAQEKAFKAMDADGNGSICIKELTVNMEAMAKKSGKEAAIKSVGKRAETRLKNEDTDGNGAISMGEFVAAAEKKAAGRKKKTQKS